MLALLLAMLAPDEALADQIARCDVDRVQVSVRYEDILQDNVATIATPNAALTSDHLACLVGVALAGRFLEFSDPEANARFMPLYMAAASKAGLGLARKYFTDRGLLEKLPVYDPARQTLPEYAVALEAFCGIAPGKSIRVLSETSLTIVSPENPIDQGDFDALGCVLLAATAADLESHGVSFGILGNEQTSSE